MEDGEETKIQERKKGIGRERRIEGEGGSEGEEGGEKTRMKERKKNERERNKNDGGAKEVGRGGRRGK